MPADACLSVYTRDMAVVSAFAKVHADRPGLLAQL